MTFRDLINERKQIVDKNDDMPSVKDVEKVVNGMPFDTSKVKVELRTLGGSSGIVITSNGKESSFEDAGYDKKDIRVLLKALQKKWPEFSYNYGRISLVQI